MDNDIIEMDILPHLQMGLEIPRLYLDDQRWYCGIYVLERIEGGKAVYVNTGRCLSSLEDFPRVLAELGMAPQRKELMA